MRVLPGAILISLSLGLAVAVAFQLSKTRQPTFQGETVGKWMIKSFEDYPRRNAEAIHALRSMGQPAVLELAKIVEREDSVLTKQLLKHADKVPAIGDFIPSKYWHRMMAAMALGEIGTNAASAIPALKQMAEDPDRNLARVAAAALVLVRNEPITNYVSASLDYGDTNSAKAYGILLSLGSHAREGIPAYLKELESTNSRVRIRAMTVLQHICTESPECVPVFTNLLTDPEMLVRTFAIDGLANCGDLAKPVAPIIADLLESSEPQCRSSALIFFQKVIPPDEFAPFAAAVRRATNDVDALVRDLAAWVLKQKTVGLQPPR